MATLYLDTEFNGFGGELMSLALVAEDDREWYGVLGLPGEIDGWVYDNVLPALFSLRPTIGPTDEVDFRASLLRFLKQFENPTIIADWYTDLHQFLGFSRAATTLKAGPMPAARNSCCSISTTANSRTTLCPMRARSVPPSLRRGDDHDPRSLAARQMLQLAR